MMYNWMIIMQPRKTMLKHRSVFGFDVDKKIHHPEEFATAKRNGIDFADDYMQGVFRMCKSTAYIQTWA